MIVAQLSLSPRDRRALIAGAAVIGALVLGGRMLPAWHRWQDRARTSADRAGLELVRSEGQLRNQRVVHDSLVARQQRLASLRPTWLSGDTPAAAGATLAADISTAAATAGVTLGALDIHADSGSGHTVVPVRVHATATGDIQGIAAFLAALERGPVRLVVRALAVQGADPALPPNRAEVLHAELTIEGPWRRPTYEARP